jgi:hypothetical protein
LGYNVRYCTKQSQILHLILNKETHFWELINCLKHNHSAATKSNSINNIFSIFHTNKIFISMFTNYSSFPNLRNIIPVHSLILCFKWSSLISLFNKQLHLVMVLPALFYDKNFVCVSNLCHTACQIQLKLSYWKVWWWATIMNSKINLPRFNDQIKTCTAMKFWYAYIFKVSINLNYIQ